MDLTSNFQVKDPFSSRSIKELLEQYVFEAVFPTLSQLFSSRVSVGKEFEDQLKNIISLVNKIHTYSNEKAHVANSAALFRTIKKVPHLHEILQEVQGVRRKPEESPQQLREQQKV